MGQQDFLLFGLSKKMARRGLRYPSSFLKGKKYPGNPRRGMYWMGPMCSTSAGFSPSQLTHTVFSSLTGTVVMCFLSDAGILAGSEVVSL